jgi:RNA polymerase sigma factor (sigma-70 family)
VTEPPSRAGEPGEAGRSHAAGAPDVGAQDAGPADRGIPDAALVRRLAARDSSALDALYSRYGRPAYSLAHRITGDPGFAEDVVQEVFLALWRDPSRYDPARAGFGSWLLSMTHHKAVDAVRREESMRRRREAATQATVALLDQDDAGGNVHEEVWSVLRGERVRKALRDLPHPQREALALAYFGGFTQREVAAITDTPLGTVKTRMLAGLRRLRGSLGGGGLEGGAEL